MMRMGIIRFTISTIALILNLVVVILYLIAMLSGWVSPTRAHMPAFLNLAFPIILFLMAVALIVNLLLRRWSYFVIYLFLFLLGSKYILTYFPLHTGNSLQEERDLRVMTYNVMNFGERDQEDGLPLAVKVILDYDPDIIALQEGLNVKSSKGGGWSIKSLLGRRYKYVHFSTFKGQTLFSKYPILVAEPIEYESYRNNGSVALLIQLPSDQKVMVVNNHMESYSLKNNELMKYKDYVTDIDITHTWGNFQEVKQRLGPDLKARAKAANKVNSEAKRLREQWQPDMEIILGDFNDTPMSYTYTKLRGDLDDAIAETGWGLSPTFIDAPLRFRIDHILYGGALEAIGSKIPKRREASDHYPLIVDFRYKTK
ncbi:MAG: endonuclease/exonuclease/phosphatase family protein [Porphyromonas sp.]|nr:endonuclease/exonuclease/phosphatase family protein [Porphyromonas sp.]